MAQETDLVNTRIDSLEQIVRDLSVQIFAFNDRSSQDQQGVTSGFDSTKLDRIIDILEQILEMQQTSSSQQPGTSQPL